MAKAKSTKIPGIRYREHETRMHGRQKDKYFYIRYQKNKKQVEESLGWSSAGWTLQKAQEVLAQIKQNIREGKYPQSLAEMRAMGKENKEAEERRLKAENAKKIMFNTVFKKYITQAKIDNTPGTYQNKLDRFRVWISPVIQKKNLLEIKKQDIEDIKENMIKKGRSACTIQDTIGLITMVYKYAIEHDIYSGNIPTSNVKILKKDNKRTRYLTHEEADILLKELAKHSSSVHDMALLSLLSGMRAGDIRKLRWEDILWKANRIKVQWRKNGVTDLIPMHSDVLKMLESRKLQSNSVLVFPGKDGKLMQRIPKTYDRVVKELGFNKGITDKLNRVVFHTLRHTYASWLVGRGVDLYTTQKLMGHKNNQMTQRYAHLAPGYLEKAVNSLESI